MTARIASRPEPRPGPPAEDGPSLGLLDGDRLALEYQAGRRQALAELHRGLRPLILQTVGQLASQGLPPTLDARDLSQQSWLILDDLARRWRPSLGAFVAYAVSSLPWALARYVRHHSPAQRARVRVETVEEDELQRLFEELAGEDGRAWDDELAIQERLAPLPPLERRVVALRVLERYSFQAICVSLGITRSRARRAFSRGLALLRGERPQPGEDLERLVRALHLGAAPDGQLPGRAWVCAQTGFSQDRYARLMRCLVAAGCIRGRTSRQPGWLVDPDATATLRRAVTNHGR